MSASSKVHHIATISELHRNLSLAKPLHPQVSLIRLDDIDFGRYTELTQFSYGFYTLSLKRGVSNKIHYGHRSYDFDEGILALVKPHQIMSIQSQAKDNITGWMLGFHPDFLTGYPLSDKINKYDFFSYNVDEALHLSDSEEQLLLNLMQQLQDEYSVRIDAFSQDVMVLQLDLLLNYVDRFYNRQFLTRKTNNRDILIRLDSFLDQYFDGGEAYAKGLPTIKNISAQLSVSASYLNTLLLSLAGSSTRDYIQHTVIKKAKLSLSLTTKPISRIGYELGFQHSQSFNKFFKKHTHISPGEFRKTIN